MVYVNLTRNSPKGLYERPSIELRLFFTVTNGSKRNLVQLSETECLATTNLDVYVTTSDRGSIEGREKV